VEAILAAIEAGLPTKNKPPSQNTPASPQSQELQKPCVYLVMTDITDSMLNVDPQLRKTFEARPDYKCYNSLKPGDFITFKQDSKSVNERTVNVRIVNVVRQPCFENLFTQYGVSNFFPGWTMAQALKNCSDNNKFRRKHNGVIGIEFEVIVNQQTFFGKHTYLHNTYCFVRFVKYNHVLCGYLSFVTLCSHPVSNFIYRSISIPLYDDMFLSPCPHYLSLSLYLSVSLSLMS
jgi:ASC-1-like (ASCH) protein